MYNVYETQTEAIQDVKSENIFERKHGLQTLGPICVGMFHF